MNDIDVDASGQRIEALLDRIAHTDPAAAALSESLVHELVRLYGAGLERILDRLGSIAPDALMALTEDPLVSGLMVLHDLHPQDLLTRVEIALDTVRPYLDSHGGGVQLLGVESGVVHLQLEGNCDGCSSSLATLQSAVEEAVLAAAPEIERIVAAEATAPAHPPPVAVGAAAGGLIPAESLLVRPPGHAGAAR